MASKEKPTEAYSLLHASGMNSSAMAVTLSHLDISQSFEASDQWMEVKYEDGSNVRILKKSRRCI
ncbi:MAG: hypothetical protein WAM14_17435 [Candidatus Nitrosopolaris sp.]